MTVTSDILCLCIEGVTLSDVTAAVRDTLLPLSQVHISINIL